MFAKTASTVTGLALLATACLSGMAAVSSAPAGAGPTCTRYAAASGRDTNPGTQAAPYRSLAKLLQASNPGDVGCLRAGDRFEQLITIRPGASPAVDPVGASTVTTSGTAAAPVIIRSTDGGRAVVGGQIHFDALSHDIVFENLNLVGLSAMKSTHLNVDGDRITLRNNDISHPRGVCVDVGGFPNNDAYQRVSAGDPAVGVVLDGNRIHGCGTDPTVNWVVDGAHADSGAHGVYLVNTQGARVVNNAIYDNKYRGLQTWPKAEGTVIENNVFDGNATNVNIGSALSDGYPWYSKDTIVRNNLITNSTLWNPGKNSAQVHGYFPNDGVDRGNRVTANCLFQADPSKNFSGNGYTQSGNTLADPGYVNRAAKDFRLNTTSPCVGKGPNWAQPTLPSVVDLAVAISGAATTGTGSESNLTAAVTNRGTTATAGSLRITVPGSATVLSATGSCTTAAGAVLCPVSLAAGASTVVVVQVGWIRPGAVAPAVTVTAAGDLVSANNSAAAPTTVSGPACTIVGTGADNSVQGTTGNDVFCGFGGNDTFMPDAGNDVFIGGAGLDRLSYWNAKGAVTVNLTQQAAWDKWSTSAIGWDTFSGVEVAYGSAFADVLVGGSGADALYGLEGNDEIWGYGGDDTLGGGAGDDTLNGGDGSDVCSQDAGVGARTACER